MEGQELAIIKKDNGIVEYQTDRGRVELSVRQIREVICPSATDAEAFLFLEHCVRLQANPFLHEIFLIKYGSSPTQIVVGKDYVHKRAYAQPTYAGHKAGIIVIKGNDVIYREGAVVFPGEKLHGAWCDVFRKDRTDPVRIEVMLSEYTTGKSNWLSKPATMIRKVAVAQGHREAYPSLFQGVYEAAEMGMETDGDDNPVIPQTRTGPSQRVIEGHLRGNDVDTNRIPRNVAELIKHGDALEIPVQVENPDTHEKAPHPLWAAAIADWGQPREIVDGYKTVNGKRVKGKVAGRDLWTSAQVAEMAERLREEAALKQAEADAPAESPEDAVDEIDEADAAPEAGYPFDGAPLAPGLDGVGEMAPLITAPPPMAQEDLVSALSAEGWTMARLCKDVLKKSSFSEHQRLGGTVDSAYAAWQKHMLDTLGVKV